MKTSMLGPALGALMLGLAVTMTPVQAQSVESEASSIQQETTLNLAATAEVTAEPDTAFLNGGVVTEARTAKEAMNENARRMAGVFQALENAGVERKDIQTSNFSVQPQYAYPKNSERILKGYTVSNQVTAKVTDLENLGEVLDTMVSLGGNSFSGIRFAVEDAESLVDQARTKAMKTAIQRAELYADAAGMKLDRIVMISESGGYSPHPEPRMMARAAFAESADVSTQISGGELSYSATVNVMFELK